ncbi:hypothetical protein Tco_0606357 [Tanacetum coccineum]
MACSLPHTDSKVKALVLRLFNEDKGRQDVLLELAFQFEDSCAVRDDLRKAYEKCTDISQESRALICTFLKESFGNDHKLHLSMYGKASRCVCPQAVILPLFAIETDLIISVQAELSRESVISDIEALGFFVVCLKSVQFPSLYTGLLSGEVVGICVKKGNDGDLLSLERVQVLASQGSFSEWIVSWWLPVRGYCQVHVARKVIKTFLGYVPDRTIEWNVSTSLLGKD